MGCEYRRRLPRERLEVEERVGIDHGREIGFVEESPDERLLLVAATEAVPERESTGATDSIEDVIERPLHGLDHKRLQDGDRLGRRRDRDVAGASPECGPACECS